MQQQWPEKGGRGLSSSVQGGQSWKRAVDNCSLLSFPQMWVQEELGENASLLQKNQEPKGIPSMNEATKTPGQRQQAKELTWL